MNDSPNIDNQFQLTRNYYLNNLDFLNWYRYFAIIKAVLTLKPSTILELGVGDGLLKNSLEPLIQSYKVLDINPRLNPDFLSDVRKFIADLKESTDLIIAADIFEHLPFNDLDGAIGNVFRYLKPGGSALVAIPHRASYFLFMTPTQKPRVIAVPTGFLSWGAFYRRFIKRKIWIDPFHCWEIGDGKIRRSDVEKVFTKNGFMISKSEKLLYVDFWILEKTAK